MKDKKMKPYSKMTQEERDEYFRKRPKLYSVETPYGIITLEEGFDSDGDPFTPGTLEEWEKEMERIRNHPGTKNGMGYPIDYKPPD